MYKVLFTDTIDGITQTHIRFDYEFLKSIKKIPHNRPAGENETDYEDDLYFKREKSKGKKHRDELAKEFRNNGFRPSVKEFIIGEFNGNFYLEDGQNTKGAIIVVNESSIKEGNGIMYDDFKGIINHFDDYWDMVDDMRAYNTCLTRWATAQFTLSADKGKVREAMLQIKELANLQEDQCTKLLFGDLNKSEYEHKKMEDACTYWMDKAMTIKNIYDRLREVGNTSRAKKIMTGDAFIVFNTLLNSIFNYPYKTKMQLNEEESLAWSKERINILIDLYCSITEDGFRKNIELNKKSNEEIPYGRQKWYRLFMGRLFKGDKGCKEFYKKDKYLKSIIDEWGTVEVSNHRNDPNYLKALPNGKL